MNDNLFLNSKLVIFDPHLFLKMDTASSTGLIKIIVFIIIGYYAVKFLARLFFPILIRKVVSKAEASFKQQYQTQQQNSGYTSKENRSGNEIISETENSNNPKSTKKVGEYVDYEEIE
jgi:uncharacterized membrane protein